MKTIIRTVGVVIIRDEKVLLVVKGNHPERLYQLPGGQIEDNETALEAAGRELEETTGISAKPDSLVEIPTQWQATITKSYGKATFSFICFICTDYTGMPEKNESATPEWVALNDLARTPLNPNTQNAIDAAIELLNNRHLG